MLFKCCNNTKLSILDALNTEKEALWIIMVILQYSVISLNTFIHS